MQSTQHEPSSWLVVLRTLELPSNSLAMHICKRRPCEYNVPHRCPRSQSSQESVNFVHSFSYQHLRPDDGHVVNSEEDDIL